jgi:hypothetical protein
VNFLVLGWLMIAYAIGLHLGVRPTRWGVLGLGYSSIHAGVSTPSHGDERRPLVP